MHFMHEWECVDCDLIIINMRNDLNVNVRGVTAVVGGSEVFLAGAWD